MCEYSGKMGISMGVPTCIKNGGEIAKLPKSRLVDKFWETGEVPMFRDRGSLQVAKFTISRFKLLRMA